MQPNNQEPSLGLRRKHEPNEVDDYTSMLLQNQIQEDYGDLIGNAACDIFINFFKQSPENHFNFGFTYNDFKAFLLKLVYMRAERSFIEKALSERINQRHMELQAMHQQQVQQQNPGQTAGYEYNQEEAAYLQPGAYTGGDGYQGYEEYQE